MREEIVEADVLCIGGGIAGLMAAIRAGELGAKVVVAEKANTSRSGGGATGNDHFRCYIPEVHGPDIQPVVQEVLQSQVGRMRTLGFVRTWMEKSFDIVKLWDSWGIPMRYEGKWEFSGHAFPGRPCTTLKYAGRDQKLVLTREAHKRGVKIENRVIVFDLLRDNDNITGAVAVSTRDERAIIFKATCVILGTGGCVRLYPAPTPGWMFNVASSPAATADGRAMAYRAGAELVNIEMPKRHAGPKYFSKPGKATWIGVFRDPQDRPVGPFVTKPDRRYGDAIADSYKGLFEDYHKSGRGPVYMDCRGIRDEDYQYMLWGLENEGNMALLGHLKEEGIDIRSHPVEFMTYELSTGGGIYQNEKAETSVRGLYAAGDEYGSGISSAATFGWIAGDNAGEYVKQKGHGNPLRGDTKSQIRERIDFLEDILDRKEGPSWKEFNIALGQVMQDYAGAMRSETLLQAGLNHLRRIKKKALQEVTARNQHELAHCLEVFSLLDIGELIFLGSLERKETRGNFIRLDYPYANPLMNGMVLICRNVAHKPVFEWRKRN